MAIHHPKSTGILVDIDQHVVDQGRYVMVDYSCRVVNTAPSRDEHFLMVDGVTCRSIERGYISVELPSARCITQQDLGKDIIDDYVLV